MINVTKEQLEVAKKTLTQIGEQIGYLCVDILGFVELFNILGAVEREVKNV